MRTTDSAWLLALAASGCEVLVGSAEERAPAETVIASPRAARASNERIDTRTKGPTPGYMVTNDIKPRIGIDTVVPTDLCVTRGALAERTIEVPTFRAVAQHHDGDAASMKVIVHGATTKARALASGQKRRQLGLKLRAQDGCNLVYVMWRLDPKPKLEVSLKRNPGARTAKECGADGYTKVKPKQSSPLPVLDDGAEHELRAEIIGDTLTAWIDDHVAWQGSLPDEALTLAGPAGIRSDNLTFDLTALSAGRRAGEERAPVKCVASDDSD